jgi:hypothetical protein
MFWHEQQLCKFNLLNLYLYMHIRYTYPRLLFNIYHYLQIHDSTYAKEEMACFVYTATV